MYGFRTYNRAGLVFAFGFMAIFFIIAASACYIVGYFNPEINDIMKWIAFGILMMGAVMILICLIFFINFLCIMYTRRHQERLNYGKTNEFDNKIFSDNPNIHNMDVEIKRVGEDCPARGNKL